LTPHANRDRPHVLESTALSLLRSHEATDLLLHAHTISKRAHFPNETRRCSSRPLRDRNVEWLPWDDGDGG
jgi:hypothetical protein